MLAVGSGLGAAVAWGLGNVLMAKASRDAGSAAFTSWFLLIEALMLLPFAVPLSLEHGLRLSGLEWSAIGGVVSGIGLLIYSVALREGVVGVVAPLSAMEGVTAALLALMGGAHASLLALGGLALALVGALASGLAIEGGSRAGPGVPFAIIGAVLFGVMLWTLSQAPGSSVISVMTMKVVGALVVFAVSRPGFPKKVSTMLPAAAADILGTLLFATGARADSATVTAVIATQFGLFAMFGGYVLFGERISRRQMIGAFTLAAAAALVTVGTP